MDSNGSIKSRVIIANRGLFVCQVAAILIVILACVVNLSLGKDNTELWASLLSGSLGYLLPSPRIRKRYDALLPHATEQQLDEVLPGQQDQLLRNASSKSDLFDGRLGSGLGGDQLSSDVVHRDSEREQIHGIS